MMIRDTLLTAALVVAFTGCSKEVTRENASADTHVNTEPGLWECEDAANQMKERLAGYRFPDDAVQKFGSPMPTAFMGVKNLSGHHLQMKILEDEVRDVLQQSGKIAFQIQSEDAQAMGDQDTFEKEFNNADGQASGGEGQGQKTRYAITASLKSVDKADARKGIQENTYIVTIKLLDRWKRMEVFVVNSKSRLRKS